MNLPVKYSTLNSKTKRVIREEYKKVQKGLCYYCKKPLKGDPRNDILQKKVTESLYPNGFFDHPEHLHHNHDTDMTIGVVHAYCNAVLWEYEGE